MFDVAGKPIVRKAVFLAYVLVILALSVYPFKEIVGSSSDKVNHVLAFAAFYGLAVWSHRRAGIVTVIVWGVAYGALIEFSQFFIPYRQCSALDLSADLSGLLAGWAAWSLYGRYRKRKTARASREGIVTNSS
ncbi:MAG: VanZ family protein [Candidatus Edwardsbacteria bacterium]|nr:VanZ family protein [Candidatus Edwardsbacteria bacterium]